MLSNDKFVKVANNSATTNVTRRDRVVALALGGPILLMLLLLALNPAYMAHLIQAETRACALPVFIVIAGLTAMAFPSLLASLSLYRSGKRGPWLSARAASDPPVRRAC